MVVGEHSPGIRDLCEAGLAPFVFRGILVGSMACQPERGTDGEASVCQASASNYERGDCGCRDSGAPNFADTTHGGTPDGGEGPVFDTGRDVAGDAGPGRDADAGSPPAHQVELPVEVIGPNGYTQTVEVGVEQTSDVETLDLRTYSIGYPQHYIDDRGYRVTKASVRLNDGEWVDIDNDIATCEAPESEMQCIPGPMHTIDFDLPVSQLGDLEEGTNTVTFRFNYPGPDERDSGVPPEPSTGYRILDLAFRGVDGEDHLVDTTFEWDDPGEWAAPEGYQTQEAVDAGAELWDERDVLIESWNGEPITASCADCHTRTGRDLEYFGFSNWSIVARSEYHGLTREEGRQIAAYIRSQTLRDRDTGEAYDPPGRPWPPPYQPGPTAVGTPGPDADRGDGEPFDEVSSQLWSAGAGVDWALEQDREMLSHLFPNGVDYEDVAIDGSLNVRQLPVALQYPDWNEWLPEVHPIDGYGPKFEQKELGAWATYKQEIKKPNFEKLRSCMADKSGSECFGELDGALSWFGRKVNKHRDDMAHRSGTAYPDYQVDYGLMRWMAVKQWEVIHKFDLMDEARTKYPEAAERKWAVPVRNVFNLASHIISNDMKGPEHAVHDPYFDTAWYDLQVVLNSGQGLNTNQTPVDWKYHFGHIYERSEFSDQLPQPLRYVRSYVRLIQNAQGDVPRKFRGQYYPEGWYLRHTQLGRMDQFPSQQLDDYREGLQGEVLNAVTRAWIEGAIVPHDWTDFSRNGGQWQIESDSTVPEFIGFWGPSTATNYANTTYSTVRRLRDRGFDPDVLAPYRDWGSKLWPRGNDASAMGENPTWSELLDTP